MFGVHTPIPPSVKRLFAVAAVTLLVKLVLAAVVPFTGDEAYFVLWGQNPDFGYYDHPPMTGWLMWLMLRLGHPEFVLRLPAVVFSQAVGLGLYLLLRRNDPDRSALAATLYLVSPVNVLNVLITTDTALLLFAFLAVAAFVRAQDRQSPGLYALAGCFLGLAFLSKYFAVLTGLSLALYTACFGRTRRDWIGLLLVFLAALPFVALHLWWNCTHGWATVLFNLFSRARTSVDLVNVPLLAVCVLYLASPPVLYYMIRRWRCWRTLWDRNDQRVLALCFLTPVLLLAVVSLRKTVGLHWLLSFVPFAFAITPAFLAERDFVRSIRWNGIFTAAHLVLVGIVLALPLETFRRLSAYPSIVMGIRPAAFMGALAAHGPGYTLATGSYSQSAVLAYHARQPVLVFGRGSLHGRQYDLMTDFRDLDRTDILVVGDSLKPERIAPYFSRTEVSTTTVHGAEFVFVRGCDFRYGQYRRDVLLPILARYYTPPPWLPCGRNPLRERYTEGNGDEP
jgi:4-amino-4-deoxy-L-arabinose transferase-like glycosyltransferase